VEHLQQTRPGFMLALSIDLDECKAARDLDLKAMDDTLACLLAQVKAVEARLNGEAGGAHEQIARSRSGVDAEAMRPERLRKFMDHAGPRVMELQSLLQEFHAVSAAMRKWFAEAPDTSFVYMMRCLTTLREALPLEKPRALPPYPRPCHLRRVAQQPKPVLRATSAPLLQRKVTSPSAALARSASQPLLRSRAREVKSRRRGSSEAFGEVDATELPKRSSTCSLATSGAEGRPSPAFHAGTVSLAARVCAKEGTQGLAQEPQAPPARTPPRRPTALQELPFSVAKLPYSTGQETPPAARSKLTFHP